MAPREKKLLTLFAIAGFVIANFFLYGFLARKSMTADAKLNEAELALQQAEFVSASRDQVIDEMDWLAENQPEPIANQDVQTKLQELCEREAKAAGLTINSQKPLPTEAPEGAHYHRAKFLFTVTGREEALYRWLARINIPSQLRIASQVRLSPDKKDDTLIDASVTIDQWFIPLPPTA